MDTLNQMPYPSPERNNNSLGGLVGIIVIIILLILGGVYFFKDKDFSLPNNSTTTPATSTNDSDLLEIEADLEALEKNNQNESQSIDGEFTATSTN